MLSMKNLLIFITLGIFIVTGCTIKSEQPEWQKKYNDPEAIRRMFANPPLFYAPHTFWFWDDTIRDEHFASSMIEEMARQRLNPGYAHPRSSGERLNNLYPSLPYEQYLEQPWFNSFGNALQKAIEHGMTLGYCDEYDWPSGQAAGRVLKQHPGLKAKYLEWKRHEVKGESTIQFDSVDFAIAGKIVNKKIDASSLHMVGEGNNIEWTAPEGNWVIYTYLIKSHAGFDGGKVNYLEPELMKAFIPLVHEQYAKHFENEMGKSIPGVFVDNEGDYGWQMAWSEYFAQRYKEMKNRDIRLWLPLLTEKDNDGLFARARCDWFDVVSDVYNKCYFEPMAGWLNQHNMYCISNLWEESLMLQTQAMGDFMRITRSATMPGTDCLEMKSQDVHDFKEVQSIAEFEDRPFMSEIMGVAGWVQTPEMMKMTINSITSFGVNHVVPHGIYVNRKIETIPYPPDWYTENPYWQYLHYWTDFARRASFITRQSTLVADVLLINPLESVWALTESYFSNEYTNKWDPRSVETENVYSDAMREMNKNNIDFLITDKYYLNKGKVESVDKSAKITINDHIFSAMVLPPVCVISHPAMNKILEFAEKGGVVILLGELPQGSPEEGMKDNTIINQIKTLKQIPNVIDLAADKNRLSKMVTVLNEKFRPQILLENSGRLYTAHRKIANNDFYWFANNTDTARTFSAWLRDGEGAAEIWDCETGEIKTIVSGKENGYCKVSLTLQPYEAFWLVFNPEEKIQNVSEQKIISAEEIILDIKWIISYPGKDTIYKTTAKVQFTKDKVINEEIMTPDYDDSSWKYYTFENQKNVNETKKSEKSENKFIYWRTKIPVGSKSVVFTSDMIGKDIWIDGEKTNLTGKSIDLPAEGSLLSYASSFEKGKLFQTSPLKFVVKKKEGCTLKSWYTYGLQQYTGYVDYETSVRIDESSAKFSIDLGKVKYMAEVFINDKSVGARLWPPFKFDTSNELKKGENKIRIRVGNLMVGDIWIKEDMGKLRTWGWRGGPDFDKYDAGLFGPIKLLITK